MTMLTIALRVAAVFLGGIAILLGIVMLASAWRTGEFQMIVASNGQTTKDIVSQATDPERFYKLLIGLGIAPIIGGAFALVWGWRRIKSG